MCTRQLERSFFSGSQLKKGALERKCKSCVEMVVDGGAAAQLAVAHSVLSYGLVDNRTHTAPKRLVKDRACRISRADAAAAQVRYTSFLGKFNLHKATYSNCKQLSIEHGVPAAKVLATHQALMALRQVQVREGHVAGCAAHDFLSTIRRSDTQRVSIRAVQSSSKEDVRPQGTFSDAPTMTRDFDLKYSSSRPSPQHISVWEAEHCLIHHVEGTVLWDGDTVVAGRVPDYDRLSDKARAELVKVSNEVRAHNKFLQRGSEVANICVDFVVCGVKCDQNTRLVMAHANHADSVATASRAMHARLKLRCLFARWVWPVVKRHFGNLFAAFDAWASVEGVRLFAPCITSATFGFLFWPKQHVDPDAWYTILVCLDKARGLLAGGDFAFASVGWVLKCSDGDVLVYNGLYPHGTTEFDPKGPLDGRQFIAFYCKKEAVSASLRSIVRRERMGPSPLHL